MQQLEQPFERGRRGRARAGVAVVQPALDRLEVPVAEVVEGQVVELVRHVGEVELAEEALDRPLRLREPGEDPALLERRRLLRRLGALGGGDDQPGRVPQLVRELRALVDRRVREAHVLGERVLQQPVARGVGAVALDQLERVDAGAERLRHPPAVRSEHRRVDDHVAERHLAEQLEPGEDHPVLPEADDLPGGRLQVAGIEVAEILGVVRPAESRERPERRREPRVEHVGLALELLRAALGARFRLGLGHGHVAVGAVPHGQLVAPPELARDAPVRRVLEGVDRVAMLALGVVDDLAVAKRCERPLLDLVHRAPPLQRDQRLDPAAAALAQGNGVAVVLPLDELVTLAQPIEDLVAGLLLGQPFEAGRRDEPVGPDAHGLVQAVVAADREVGRVVARRDLQGAGAEAHLHPLVGDHRHAPLDPRHDHLAPDQVAVAVVVRVHRDRDVGRDRRRPHRGDLDEAVAVGQRVADRGQRVVDVDMRELEIGERRQVVRAPVDDPVRAVDPAAAVQVHEEPHDGADVRVVHREARAPVVERRAHPAELDEDLPAVLVEPLPDTLLEPLAAELLPRGALEHELLLDHVLGRDPRMVVAGLEERVEALHPLHPDDGVADRELQGVPRVELAGDVRRRVRVDVGRPRRIGVGVVVTLALPGLLPALLDAVRVVTGLHHRSTILRTCRWGLSSDYAGILPGDRVALHPARVRRGTDLAGLQLHGADPAERPRRLDGDVVAAAPEVGDHVVAEARLEGERAQRDRRG